MSESNWIERKFQRERILKEKARDVWEDARSAIQDCCNSFRSHSGNTVDDKLENGIRIRLVRTFQIDTAIREAIPVRRRLLAAFNQEVPRISTTVDEGQPREYTISADDTHAFIADGNRELSADAFSEMVLNSYFFKPPEFRQRTSTAPIDWQTS